MSRHKTGETDPELTAIQKRREEVSNLYLQQWTQRRIAEKLRVGQSTVSDDLSAIRQMWRDSAVMKFDERQQQELAKVDAVEREAWEAWERSKKKSKRSSSKTVKGAPEGDKEPPVEREEETEVEENRDGDPRHLDMVMRCVEKRCKILGLDAPLKVAPTTPDGKETYDPSENRAVAPLLAQVAALLQRGGVESRPSAQV